MESAWYYRACVQNNTSSSPCSPARGSTTNTGRGKNILHWTVIAFVSWLHHPVFVCVAAPHFASPARGTAVLWLLGCSTCWWYRWSISVTTWLNGRHVQPWGRKPPAAPTGDSSWTPGSTPGVSVATGQNSWLWETNVMLPLRPQLTWFRGLIHIQKCNHS